MRMTAHPLYKTWNDMITRCYNKNHNTYRFYGAKGVTVCDEWRYNFWKFAKDMKKKPSPKHQLDRIDNSKGYFLKNCRWATPKQNCRNKTTNLYIEYNGENLCATEWSSRLGLHRCGVSRRILLGWDPIKAITTPKNFNKDRVYKPK